MTQNRHLLSASAATKLVAAYKRAAAGSVRAFESRNNLPSTVKHKRLQSTIDDKGLSFESNITIAYKVCIPNVFCYRQFATFSLRVRINMEIM